jgi:hypothetical protein
MLNITLYNTDGAISIIPLVEGPYYAVAMRENKETTNAVKMTNDSFYCCILLGCSLYWAIIQACIYLHIPTDAEYSNAVMKSKGR